ncbi:MAG TPA: hypothetical protein VFQ71_13250 [Gaiellales bacterium]|nr:hypothetical protein [Gaiellales bacterium]
MIGQLRRVMAAAAVGAAALALLPATADASGRQALLHRYQPVTVLDGLERFAPTTVGSFVGDAVLETQTAPGQWAVVDASPRPGGLPVRDREACTAQDLSPCFRLNQATCSPADGPAGTACYRDAWQYPAPRSVVYGRAVRRGDATLLQYWYFSYDDLYSYDYPPDPLFWQTHEGDWELVDVLVLHGRPVTVGYSQHCTGERRPWADVERWQGSTHPVVYVANGSHANLFAPGEHPIAEQCIPPQAIALLQQLALPLPADHAHPGSAVYGPAGLSGVSATGLVRVSLRTPRWIRFSGTWGEAQLFHAPAPVGTVADGYSPASPSQQDSWRHPLQTLAAWPVTS